MTDPAKTITITTRDALRVAELLDYMADLADHARSQFEGDELDEFHFERLSALNWVRQLRAATETQQN